MKKSLIILPIVASLFFAGIAFADDGEEHDEDVLEIITTTDLGVEDPGVLPTSPFYFFKEVGRTFQRAFTFNRVAKAELELRITNEKAAEVKKTEEEHPNDVNALQGALENYQQAQERLKLRIESLGENSDNPNIDAFLEKLTDRIVTHEKLFEELIERHDAQKNIIQSIREGIEKTAGKAAEKDTPERFKERLRLRLQEGKGSDIKHFRSVDFLERIEKHTPEETRLRLEELREDFAEKVRLRLENAADEGEEGVQRLGDIIKRIPGDAFRRSVLLEEIRARTSDKGAEFIERVHGELEDRVVDSDDFSERVEHQIKAVQEKIERLESKIVEEGDDTSDASSRLLEQAKDNIEKAKTALREGNPREAFGLARSAEAITGNILRILQGGIDTARDLPQRLDEIKTRVLERVPTSLGGTLNCLRADPVCGSDGKTYVCGVKDAELAGVDVAHDGRCVERESDVRELRKYQSRDAERCALTQILCVEGLQSFSDDTGCGCEKSTPTPTPTVEPSALEIPTIIPTIFNFTIEADDNRLSPSEIRVKKGTKVMLTFNVSDTNVYFGGLDFRSSKFNTPKIAPGGSTTVEFTADESFEFKSYWPASNRLKAIGKVIVE